ncbi:hypothetical protein L596_016839 [Steinernema carpocapsae]|uniref:Saposin B-type domain-containing protein n=1 Tax=Steinernema carpocapsae TaxID=34508 RepID=A0A4U5NK95_STECR|nr:hypothetical protein L596_016839 [Steinernema carpocapsae]
MRFSLFLFLIVTLSCFFSLTQATCKACITTMTEAKERCLKEGISTGCPATADWLLSVFIFNHNYGDLCTANVSVTMIEYWKTYILKRFSDSVQNDPVSICGCGIPWPCYNCE